MPRPPLRPALGLATLAAVAACSSFAGDGGGPPLSPFPPADAGGDAAPEDAGARPGDAAGGGDASDASEAGTRPILYATSFEGSDPCAAVFQVTGATTQIVTSAHTGAQACRLCAQQGGTVRMTLPLAAGVPEGRHVQARLFLRFVGGGESTSWQFDLSTAPVQGEYGTTDTPVLPLDWEASVVRTKTVLVDAGAATSLSLLLQSSAPQCLDVDDLELSTFD